MIDLGSVAGLYYHDHQLHAYCPTLGHAAARRNDRRRPGSAAAAVHGALPMGGAAGRLQVRPPMPMYSTANGWMQLR